MKFRRTKLEIFHDSLISAGLDFAETKKLVLLARERIEKKNIERRNELNSKYREEYKVSDENYRQVMSIAVDIEVHLGTPLSIGVNHPFQLRDLGFRQASELRYISISDVDDDYQFMKLVYQELAKTKREWIKRFYKARIKDKIEENKHGSNNNKASEEKFGNRPTIFITLKSSPTDLDTSDLHDLWELEQTVNSQQDSIRMHIEIGEE